MLATATIESTRPFIRNPGLVEADVSLHEDIKKHSRPNFDAQTGPPPGGLRSTLSALAPAWTPRLYSGLPPVWTPHVHSGLASQRVSLLQGDSGWQHPLEGDTYPRSDSCDDVKLRGQTERQGLLGSRQGSVNFQLPASGEDWLGEPCAMPTSLFATESPPSILPHEDRSQKQDTDLSDLHVSPDNSVAKGSEETWDPPVHAHSSGTPDATPRDEAKPLRSGAAVVTSGALLVTFPETLKTPAAETKSTPSTTRKRRRSGSPGSRKTASPPRSLSADTGSRPCGGEALQVALRPPPAPLPLEVDYVDKWIIGLISDGQLPEQRRLQLRTADKALRRKGGAGRADRDHGQREEQEAGSQEAPEDVGLLARKTQNLSVQDASNSSRDLKTSASSCKGEGAASPARQSPQEILVEDVDPQAESYDQTERDVAKSLPVSRGPSGNIGKGAFQLNINQVSDANAACGTWRERSHEQTDHGNEACEADDQVSKRTLILRDLVSQFSETDWSSIETCMHNVSPDLLLNTNAKGNDPMNPGYDGQNDETWHGNDRNQPGHGEFKIDNLENHLLDIERNPAGTKDTPKNKKSSTKNPAVRDGVGHSAPSICKASPLPAEVANQTAVEGRGTSSSAGHSGRRDASSVKFHSRPLPARSAFPRGLDARRREIQRAGKAARLSGSGAFKDACSKTTGSTVLAGDSDPLRLSHATAKITHESDEGDAEVVGMASECVTVQDGEGFAEPLCPRPLSSAMTSSADGVLEATGSNIKNAEKAESDSNRRKQDQTNSSGLPLKKKELSGFRDTYDAPLRPMQEFRSSSDVDSTRYEDTGVSVHVQGLKAEIPGIIHQGGMTLPENVHYYEIGSSLKVPRDIPLSFRSATRFWQPESSGYSVGRNSHPTPFPWQSEQSAGHPFSTVRHEPVFPIRGSLLNFQNKDVTDLPEPEWFMSTVDTATLKHMSPRTMDRRPKVGRLFPLDRCGRMQNTPQSTDRQSWNGAWYAAKAMMAPTDDSMSSERCHLQPESTVTRQQGPLSRNDCFGRVLGASFASRTGHHCLQKPAQPLDRSETKSDANMSVRATSALRSHGCRVDSELGFRRSTSHIFPRSSGTPERRKDHEKARSESSLLFHPKGKASGWISDVDDLTRLNGCPSQRWVTSPFQQPQPALTCGNKFVSSALGLQKGPRNARNLNSVDRTTFQPLADLAERSKNNNSTDVVCLHDRSSESRPCTTSPAPRHPRDVVLHQHLPSASSSTVTWNESVEESGPSSSSFVSTAQKVSEPLPSSCHPSLASVPEEAPSVPAGSVAGMVQGDPVGPSLTGLPMSTSAAMQKMQEAVSGQDLMEALLDYMEEIGD